MKTIGVFQLGQKVFDTYDFDGVWKDSFGCPEKNFSTVIYGDSGNGKTDFCVKLAKYMAKFTKVLYVSHEEGISKSIQEAFERNNMKEVSGKVILAEKCTVDEMIEYLKKRNSPGFLIIDSLDYMRLTTDQYKLIRAQCPKKAIAIISWSVNNKPKSQFARDIEYMADIKISVRSFKAHPRSRYGGNKEFVIWNKHHTLKAPASIGNIPTGTEQAALEL
ncbi:MAG: hypothetical protein U0T77_10600 [Chitinophagales bacterium]